MLAGRMKAASRNWRGSLIRKPLAESFCETCLERDDFSSNHHPAPAFCLSMIFFLKPVPTFRDHALSGEISHDCIENGKAGLSGAQSAARCQFQRPLVAQQLDPA